MHLKPNTVQGQFLLQHLACMVWHPVGHMLLGNNCMISIICSPEILTAKYGLWCVKDPSTAGGPLRVINSKGV